MKENRTEFVSFRVSVSRKTWLNEIANSSGYESGTEFLNNHIGTIRRYQIFSQSLKKSKIVVGKEFGMTSEIAHAVKSKEDITAMFEGEKGLEFINRWFEEFKNNVKKGAEALEMKDIVDYLSTEKGNDSLFFFFNNYPQLKELYEIINIKEVTSNKRKGGSK